MANLYSQKQEADALKVCCIPQKPRGEPESASYCSCQPNLRIPRKCLAARIFALPTAAEAFVRPRRMPSRPLGFRCIIRKRIML